jgi:collagen adhesin
MKRLLNVVLLILAIFVGGLVVSTNTTVFADENADNKTSVSVEVNWIHEELLASVEVDLFANDKLINTATITSDADWKYVFENLPKYNDEGNLIKYTVVQKRTGMEYYLKSRVSGNMEEGFVITNFQIKSVHIIKLWNISHPGEPSPMRLDPNEYGNNLNGKLEVVNGVREDAPVDAYGNPIDSPVSKIPMPKSITVNLLADGKIVATKVITEEDNWECNFENMPKYDEKDGHEIKYEVKEEPVKGYKATYHYLYFGNFIINKSVVDVSVEKKWVGTPMDEAEVTLYRDYEVSEYDVLTETFKKSVKTEAVETVKLNKDNNWKHTFKEL